MSSLFDKPQQMRPADAAAVASLRLGDARALADTGEDERAGGAMYMAGLAVEVLLKGQLIRLYPELESAVRPTEKQMARRHDLVWRHHNLLKLCEELPSVISTLNDYSSFGGDSLVDDLSTVARTWTVYARYSTATVTLPDADQVLRVAVSLLEVLR